LTSWHSYPQVFALGRAMLKELFPMVKRGVVAGLPEWYKEQLAQSQFEAVIT
jgi:hypothetical protein